VGEGRGIISLALPHELIKLGTKLANWKRRALLAVLLLWGVQVLWLAWDLARGEGGALVRCLSSRCAGVAPQQSDPFYRWIKALGKIMPPGATYVFLDNYEAGKDIEARYILYPRREVSLPPLAPASFLFDQLLRDKASFLVIRESGPCLGPGVEAARESPAFEPVDLPGPGLAFKVESSRLQGGFYD
jgi:hypothetical protein